MQKSKSIGGLNMKTTSNKIVKCMFCGEDIRWSISKSLKKFVPMNVDINTGRHICKNALYSRCRTYTQEECKALEIKMREEGRI